MAATWIHPIHINKGKTIAQVLSERTGYAKNKEKTSLTNAVSYAANSDKTDTGELVTAYGCTVEAADMEFLLSKREYLAITGRTQDNDILAYHIRQSFKPGEITPQKANEIGQELARKFTKNAHAYIVCTHVDKRHLHNHIIFNSTTLDSTLKFQNPLGSNIIIRRISDQLCLENGLSVIGNPKPSRGQNYHKWKEQKVGLLIDLQNSIKAQNSAGYAHWARIFSLKEAAKTLLFLQDNGLTDLDKLSFVAQEAKDDFNAIQSEIKAISTRQEQIATLQKHIGAYRKTRDIFVAYGRANNKQKFYSEHEVEIEKHKDAKAYFNRINLGKLPTIAALRQEYAALTVEKKILYKDYHPKRDFMKSILNAKQNVRLMLRDVPSPKEKEKPKPKQTKLQQR